MSPNFVHVAFGRGSVLLWQGFDVLRISGCGVDDVMFSYYGWTQRRRVVAAAASSTANPPCCVAMLAPRLDKTFVQWARRDGACDAPFLHWMGLFVFNLCVLRNVYIIIIIASVPLLERSCFHEVLPTSLILGVSPRGVQAKVVRLEIRFQRP